MTPAMVLAAALLALCVLALLWRLFRREEPKPWIQATSCPACGWTGQTSRYAGRCPKCNARIGEQKASRRGAL